MRRRTRFVAALAATLAFTLSFAASVKASTCAAEFEMAARPMPVSHAMAEHDTARQDAAHHAGIHDGGMHHSGMHHDGMRHDGAELPEHDCMTQTSGDEAPYCPFGPPGASASCAATVSLPTSANRLAPLGDGAAEVAVAVDELPVLLLPASLFHPPRS